MSQISVSNCCIYNSNQLSLCRRFKVKEIVNELQSGNIQALEEVILLYQQQIYCYILKMTRNRDDAKDLAQEVFITVFE